jgi:hypothetical protein
VVGSALDRQRDAAGRNVEAIFKDLEAKKRAEVRPTDYEGDYTG